MDDKLVVICVAVLGILFVLLAFIYWTTPANLLPSYLPGFAPDSQKIHFKHGIASLLLGFGTFAFAWFQSGKKSS